MPQAQYLVHIALGLVPNAHRVQKT